MKNFKSVILTILVDLVLEFMLFVDWNFRYARFKFHSKTYDINSRTGCL